jgi:hypothetical protein
VRVVICKEPPGSPASWLRRSLGRGVRVLTATGDDLTEALAHIRVIASARKPDPPGDPFNPSAKAAARAGGTPFRQTQYPPVTQDQINYDRSVLDMLRRRVPSRIIRHPTNPRPLSSAFAAADSATSRPRRASRRQA